MKPSTIHPQCPICKESSEPLFVAADQHMYRCEKCFLSFVYPTPSDEFLNLFYSNFHKNFNEGGGYEYWEGRMSLDFNSKIKKLRSVSTNKSRILDVGCGKGFFVKYCLENGLNAEGIDLSNIAIEYAKDELGVIALCGKIEDFPELEGQYDVVTFWATIEHVPNPIQTLEAIKKVLKPGGYLLLDTGIGNDWLDKLLPGVNQWYDPPQHLFVFSKESLILLLGDTGFIIEDIDTCFDRSFTRKIIRLIRGGMFAVSLRLIEFIFRTKNKSHFVFTRYPLGNLISIVAKRNN